VARRRATCSGILYLYFLSQTLFRYRLLDLNELVGKMAVLATLVLLLSAVYGVLLYWIGSGQQASISSTRSSRVRDPDLVRAVETGSRTDQSVVAKAGGPSCAVDSMPCARNCPASSTFRTCRPDRDRARRNRVASPMPASISSTPTVPATIAQDSSRTATRSTRRER